jgi:hypothetical protein
MLETKVAQNVNSISELLPPPHLPKNAWEVGLQKLTQKYANVVILIICVTSTKAKAAKAMPFFRRHWRPSFCKIKYINVKSGKTQVFNVSHPIGSFEESINRDLCLCWYLFPSTFSFLRSCSNCFFIIMVHLYPGKTLLRYREYTEFITSLFESELA